MTASNEGTAEAAQSADIGLQALPALLGSPRVSVAEHYHLDNSELGGTDVQPARDATGTANGDGLQGDATIQIDDRPSVPPVASVASFRNGRTQSWAESKWSKYALIIPIIDALQGRRISSDAA